MSREPIDAEFEVISGPLPSKEMQPPSRWRPPNILPLLRRIYWTVIVVTLAGTVLAFYLSPRVDIDTSKPPLPVPPVERVANAHRVPQAVPDPLYAYVSEHRRWFIIGAVLTAAFLRGLIGGLWDRRAARRAGGATNYEPPVS